MIIGHLDHKDGCGKPVFYVTKRIRKGDVLGSQNTVQEKEFKSYGSLMFCDNCGQRISQKCLSLENIVYYE